MRGSISAGSNVTVMLLNLFGNAAMIVKAVG
jgi:hypothetical protein